jgi:Na+/melibiose symporter-like transporter
MFESLKNPNFKALFLYGLTVGIAAGLGMALYLYNTTYFFGFSGTQIGVTGLWILIAPVCAIFAAPFFGARFGKKRAAIYAILLNIALYPIPYILVLAGAWPELGSWLSLYVYSIFVVVEVFCGIIGGVLLDSMMADVVEDSEVVTERRSEGLFFAARGFAGKAISAGGIVGAGIIVSLVGLDAITSVEQVTHDVRVNIAVLFLPLYCLLNVGALYFVSQYRIDRDDHGDNLDKLAERARIDRHRREGFSVD